VNRSAGWTITRHCKSPVRAGSLGYENPQWTFKAMYVHRIAGGKIVEEWTEGDIGPFQERLDEEMRERERVEQEMRVARTIQQANLPKEVPTLEGWKIAPHCQPAREVGGDFYDFH
jgi:hypothetical protein